MTRNILKSSRVNYSYNNIISALELCVNDESNYPTLKSWNHRVAILDLSFTSFTSLREAPFATEPSSLHLSWGRSFPSYLVNQKIQKDTKGNLYSAHRSFGLSPLAPDWCSSMSHWIIETSSWAFWKLKLNFMYYRKGKACLKSSQLIPWGFDKKWWP